MSSEQFTKTDSKKKKYLQKKDNNLISRKRSTKITGSYRLKSLEPDSKKFSPDFTQMKMDGTNSSEAIFDTTGATNIESAYFVVDRLTSGMNSKSVGYVNMGLAALEDMEPNDPLEGVLLANVLNLSKLSSHMIGLASKSDSVEVLDDYLTAANKSSRLMLKHIETLVSYRTKGKQTISVQHQNVNVNAGAQAIVGNVGGRVSDEK